MKLERSGLAPVKIIGKQDIRGRWEINQFHLFPIIYRKDFTIIVEVVKIQEETVEVISSEAIVLNNLFDFEMVVYWIDQTNFMLGFKYSKYIIFFFS